MISESSRVDFVLFRYSRLGLSLLYRVRDHQHDPSHRRISTNKRVLFSMTRGQAAYYFKSQNISGIFSFLSQDTEANSLLRPGLLAALIICCENQMCWDQDSVVSRPCCGLQTNKATSLWNQSNVINSPCLISPGETTKVVVFSPIAETQSAVTNHWSWELRNPNMAARGVWNHLTDLRWKRKKCQHYFILSVYCCLI